jgi:signal transduction histidine kinase
MTNREGAPVRVTGKRLNRVVVSVFAAGSITVAGALALAADAPTGEWWQFAVVGLAFLVGEMNLVHVRIGHDQCSYTFGEAAVVVGLLTLPAPWVAVLAPAAVATAHVVARRSAMKVGYNASVSALAVAAAGLAWTAVGERLPGSALADAAAVVAGTLAFTLINGVLVSAVVAAAEGVRARLVFGQAGWLRLIAWVGNTAAGLLVVAAAHVHLAAVVVGPLLLAGMLFAHQAYARAVEDRDLWRGLQATSSQLARLDRDGVADVVLARALTMFRASSAELMLVDGARADVLTATGSEPASRTQLEAADLTSGFWPRARAEGEPFVMSLASAPANQRAEMVQLGLVSAVVAPIPSVAGCIGTLRLGFRGEVQLAPRELAALATFTEHIGIALLNARLFQDVAEERSKLERILGAASDGIVEIDRAGLVTSWNPAVATVTGRTEQHALGHRLDLGDGARVVSGAPSGVLTPEWVLDRLATEDQIEAVVALGSVGEERFLELTASAVRGVDGALESAVLVVRDVTARREADEAKQDFVATVSHELRTPITSLKGWLLTLMRPEYQPDAHEREDVYRTLMHQTSRLQRLVEDLLSISVMERGEFTVAALPVELDGVIDKCVADLALRSPDRPVTVRSIGFGAALADPGRVEQVVGNLLSNADKYSPVGLPVEVEIERLPGRVEVRVTDHGRGIPVELQEVVFERFRRLGHHLTRETGGAGLGLHIARRLVTAMGGEIWVESAPGTGATFGFTLPAAPIRLAAVPDQSTVNVVSL